MSYTFSAEPKGKYLHVRVTGQNSPETVRDYLHQVYQAVASTSIRSVLIEENLAGPRLAPIDAYRLIQQASAETSPVVQKIAYLDVSPDRSDEIIDLGVAVARDTGVNVRSFNTFAEAEAWLLGPDD